MGEPALDCLQLRDTQRRETFWTYTQKGKRETDSHTSRINEEDDDDMSRPEKYQLLPELPPEQFEALKADIAERGVIVAVVVDEFGAILDGHNRARACRELGINDYPVEVRSGLTEAEKRALARNLNVLRRHLTREQVRSLIADQLRDTPEWSNRRVAGGLGVDDKTVASVRMGLMATSEILQLDKTVGTDGKARQAPAKRRRKNHSSPLADDELFLDDEDDEADEAVALDPTQDKVRRREEREQRKAEKEWEAIGATAEKRAKFAHAIDLINMGADPNSEKVVKLMREASLVIFGQL
jgi:ParB-like chromosome segregation protein Spo0J